MSDRTVSVPVKPEDMAVSLFNAPSEVQFEFFAAFATLLTDQHRACILEQVTIWADEKESIALAAFGWCLNERDRPCDCKGAN